MGEKKMTSLEELINDVGKTIIKIRNGEPYERIIEVPEGSIIKEPKGEDEEYYLLVQFLMNESFFPVWLVSVIFFRNVNIGSVRFMIALLTEKAADEWIGKMWLYDPKGFKYKKEELINKKNFDEEMKRITRQLISDFIEKLRDAYYTDSDPQIFNITKCKNLFEVTKKVNADVKKEKFMRFINWKLLH